MTYVEHYFENLLFNGKDVLGNYNRDSLTLHEQRAVEECADYVLYSLFDNREAFLQAMRPKGGDAEWESMSSTTQE